ENPPPRDSLRERERRWRRRRSRHGRDGPLRQGGRSRLTESREAEGTLADGEMREREVERRAGAATVLKRQQTTPSRKGERDDCLSTCTGQRRGERTRPHRLRRGTPPRQSSRLGRENGQTHHRRPRLQRMCTGGVRNRAPSRPGRTGGTHI